MRSPRHRRLKGRRPLHRPGPVPSPVKARSPGAPPPEDIEGVEGGPLPEEGAERGRNRFAAALSRTGAALKRHLLSLVPEDPIEKMRFKLHMLGILRFPVSFLILAAVSVLITMFLWYLFFDYGSHFMVYSRRVSVLFLMIPTCVAIFSLLYFGINLSLLNRKERSMTAKLDEMLEEEAAKELEAAGLSDKVGPEEDEDLEDEAGPEGPGKGSPTPGKQLPVMTNERTDAKAV
jgi:low affinity Fe/Cu permease